MRQNSYGQDAKDKGGCKEKLEKDKIEKLCHPIKKGGGSPMDGKTHCVQMTAAGELCGPPEPPFPASCLK